MKIIKNRKAGISMRFIVVAIILFALLIFVLAWQGVLGEKIKIILESILR